MKIGFIGLTHLGLVMSLAVREKGFEVVAVDESEELVTQLNEGVINFAEPGLTNLLKSKTSGITFTSDFAMIKNCSVIYVSHDVSTRLDGSSDLSDIERLIKKSSTYISESSKLIILSQVPPGFTRNISNRYHFSVFYQVETLIFGQAIDRALHPERIIFGSNNSLDEIDPKIMILLESFGCRILITDYETAELTKITINLFLAASITMTNSVAEICEAFGAFWPTVMEALQMDKRIGENAYLTPGLGISGGNIERDLNNIIKVSDALQTDSAIFRAITSSSKTRKLWPTSILRKYLPPKIPKYKVAVWGLAYKKDTSSTRNSPAIENIKNILKDYDVIATDPIVPLPKELVGQVDFTHDALKSIEGIDALMILTDWPNYKKLLITINKWQLQKILIIDPYSVLDNGATQFQRYLTLGQRSRILNDVN